MSHKIILQKKSELPTTSSNKKEKVKSKRIREEDYQQTQSRKSLPPKPSNGKSKHKRLGFRHGVHT